MGNEGPKMSEKTKNVWIINGLLAVILLLLGGLYLRTSGQNAYAAGGGWETDGVMALSTSATENLVLVDTKNHNFMVYRVQGKGKFTLIGARSYEYDVMYEDTAYNPDIVRGFKFMDSYQLYNRLQQTKPKP